jgi:hypothetical protein
MRKAVEMASNVTDVPKEQICREQGMEHLRDILRGPGEFQRVTNSQGTTFLEKMLPDGRGCASNSTTCSRGLSTDAIAG